MTTCRRRLIAPEERLLPTIFAVRHRALRARRCDVIPGTTHAQLQCALPFVEKQLEFAQGEVSPYAQAFVDERWPRPVQDAATECYMPGSMHLVQCNGEIQVVQRRALPFCNCSMRIRFHLTDNDNREWFGRFLRQLNTIPSSAKCRMFDPIRKTILRNATSCDN